MIQLPPDPEHWPEGLEVEFVSIAPADAPPSVVCDMEGMIRGVTLQADGG